MFQQRGGGGGQPWLSALATQTEQGDRGRVSNEPIPGRHRSRKTVEHVEGWQNTCHIPFWRKSVAGDSTLTCEHACYTSVLTSGKQEWCCWLLLHVKILILAIDFPAGPHKTHAAWWGSQMILIDRNRQNRDRCCNLSFVFPAVLRGEYHEETPPTQTYRNDRLCKWEILLDYCNLPSMNDVQTRPLVDGAGMLTQTFTVG